MPEPILGTVPPLDQLPAGRWEINPSGSSVSIGVNSMILLTVSGTMSVARGFVEVAQGTGSTSLVAEAAVDAGSYTTGNSGRDKHVHNEDFLHADQYPEILWRLTGAAQNGQNGTLRVPGEVTVKTTTVPLEFVVSALTLAGQGATLSAAAEVDRFAVGVSYGPTFMVGKMLDIAVTASFDKVH